MYMNKKIEDAFISKGYSFYTGDYETVSKEMKVRLDDVDSKIVCTRVFGEIIDQFRLIDRYRVGGVSVLVSPYFSHAIYREIELRAKCSRKSIMVCPWDKNGEFFKVIEGMRDQICEKFNLPKDHLVIVNVDDFEEIL